VDPEFQPAPESSPDDSTADYFDSIEDALRAPVTPRPAERHPLGESQAAMAAQIRTLKEDRSRLLLLLDVCGRINSVLSSQDVLERVMDSVMQVSMAQRGFLVLLDGQGEPQLEISRNLEGADHGPQETFLISRSILTNAIETGRTVFVNDALSNPAFTSYKSVRDLSLQTVICLPLQIDNRSLGAIYLDSRSVSGMMSADGLALLEAFASQAAVAINNARAHESLKIFQSRLENENRSLKRALRTEFTFDSLIGRSPAMNRLFDVLGKVSSTNVTVLVQGETGTGKELVARAIHNASPRRGGPFISLNCSAVPESLFESELFGHKRGAFTGATDDRAGLVQEAGGGTLFLDEIGEMPPAMQAKLLRVVQEQEYRRVGESRDRRADVRWVAATNRDLKEEVRAGRFREDLFYRLNVVAVTVPALRERPEDILMLADHFLRRSAGDMGRELFLTPETRSSLLAHTWPGNVRELENAMHRACALTTEGALTPEHLVPAVAVAVADDATAGGRLKDRLLRAERIAIQSALRLTQGNISRAAQTLGVSRQHLHNRIRKLDIASTGRP
jgi:transcriptional regulator with GAF, ATPase, and Fis domain